MTRPARVPIASLVALLLAPSLAWALAVGQQDTFEDGTTQGWLVGGLASGGPAGAGDHYLLLTAAGSGADSRLATANMTQWTGDFIAAGITGIRMDLKNLGSTDLALRLLFVDATDEAFSTKAFKLPAGSDWTPAFFSTAPSDLSALGSGSITAALHDTTELRLYHSLVPGFPGDPIEARLGVDNITATPEPTSVVLLGSGLLALCSLKAWRGRKSRD